jgi:hypothetical protein
MPVPLPLRELGVLRATDLGVISAVIISLITARPTVVHIANSPSPRQPRSSGDRRSSSGNSTPRPQGRRQTRQAFLRLGDHGGAAIKRPGLL